MTVLANTGFGTSLIFICAAIAICYLYKKYRDLKNYTFRIEQSLLQDRPEMHIPSWRKQQRNKVIYRRAFKVEDYQDHVKPAGPSLKSGSKTFTLD